MREIVIKKCNKCGAYVKVINDCNCEGCGIKCCDDSMKILVPNSVDAAFEKHVPVYEIKGDKIIVVVNHVMEDDHYIEWITLLSDNEEYTKSFVPGEECRAEFKYIPGSKLYAYCNKHGLWSSDVE